MRKSYFYFIFSLFVKIILSFWVLALLYFHRVLESFGFWKTMFKICFGWIKFLLFSSKHCHRLFFMPDEGVFMYTYMDYLIGDKMGHKIGNISTDICLIWSGELSSLRRLIFGRLIFADFAFFNKSAKIFSSKFVLNLLVLIKIPPGFSLKIYV